MDSGAYYNPTKILFGKKTEEQIGAEVAPYATRVLLVSGQNRAEQAGLLDRVRRSLTDAGIEFAELPGVRPNPDLSTVWAGIRLARQEAVSLILAVGGGSVIDAAKAIAMGAPNADDVWEYFEGRKVPASVLPVGVVLTSPGSGSESSKSTVIRNDDANETRTYQDDRIRPVVAALNPEVTYSLPAFNTAAGLADATSHVLEKYFTDTKDAYITDRLSEAVLQTLFEIGPRAVQRPNDYAARSNVMWAAKVAHDGSLAVGRERDTAARTIAHELTSRYGIANGAALAVLVPAWLEHTAQHNPGRFRLFAARLMGKDLPPAEAPAAVVQFLRDYYARLGLPATLRDLGVEEEKLAEIAKTVAEQNGGSIGVFVPLNEQGILEVLEKAAGMDRTQDDRK